MTTLALPKRWLIVLFVLVAAMPVRLWFSLGPFHTLTILDIVLWFLAMGWFLAPRSRGLKVGPQPLLVALCVPVVIAVLSLGWSCDPLSTVKMIIYSATAVVGYLVPINLFRRYSSRVIADSIGWLLLISISLAFLYWAQGPYTASFARLNSPFWGRSNDFATVVVLYVPFFLAVARVTRRKRYSFLAFGALLTVVLTMSRGVILAALVVLGFELLRRKFSLRRIAKIAVTLCLLAFLLSAFVWQVEQKTGIRILKRRLTNSVNTEARLERFSVALRMISEAPLLGYGGGRYIGKDVNSMDSAFHNTYLEQWASYGIVFGSLVILALISLPLPFLGWNKRHGLSSTMWRSIGLGVIIYLLISILETSNEAVMPRLMFHIFLGLSVAYLYAFEKEQSATT